MTVLTLVAAGLKIAGYDVGGDTERAKAGNGHKFSREHNACLSRSAALPFLTSLKPG